MLSNLLFAVCPKVIALIIGAYYYRYLSTPFRLILGIVLLGALTETGAFLYNLTLHISNAWIFNIYMISEFGLYCAAVWYFFPANIRKLVPVIFIADFSVWVYQIARHSVFEFSIISLITGALLISVLYFVVLVLNILHSDQALSKNPLFWLSVSILLYYVCGIPAMSTITEQIDAYVHKRVNIPMININNLLNATSNLLTGYCFYLLGKQKQLPL